MGDISYHAKHRDSIYWQAGKERLYVNLFIPSRARWEAGGMAVSLDKEFPLSERVRLRIGTAPVEPRTLAVRLPGWCKTPGLALNGAPADYEKKDGYAHLRRQWRAGDEIVLTLPMHLSVEPAPDDPETLTYRHGPLILAADLGKASEPFERLPPALPAGEPGTHPAPDPDRPMTYRLATMPEPVTLMPFFNLYDRRTAVYFPRVTREAWAEKEAAYRTARKAQADIERRTVDTIRLGEPQSERHHNFRDNHSDVIAFGTRNGRQAWWGVGNYIEFDLKVKDGPMILRALYWGQETDKDFIVSVDGKPIATERRPCPSEPGFDAVNYPLPPALTESKTSVAVRFETQGSDAPVYECRMLRK